MYQQTEKPPPDVELNGRCEITLLNVFGKKKAGVDANVAVAAFEKKLKRYCADCGAKFVFYKPDGGIWRFEVRTKTVIKVSVTTGVLLACVNAMNSAALGVDCQCMLLGVDLVLRLLVYLIVVQC